MTPTLSLDEYEPGEQFPWLRVLGGSVTVARQTGSPTWFASVHAHAGRVPRERLDAHPWDDVPVVTRNGTIWETDLIPHELHRLFGDDRFVWGGDLNSAQQMDDNPRFAGGNRALREVWHASGFVDTRPRFFADEQQTYFNPKSDPYQLDHVFADALTEARVTDWRIDTDPVIAEPPCSDHAMIRFNLA